MAESVTTNFERLGGEPVLRKIVKDFVQRIMTDPMIGFFFRSITKERLVRLEYEHAAQSLGAPIEYSGRPLDQAHARHSIMGGHFDRRSMILKNTLQEHHVSDDIIEAWLAHVESLRSLITKQGMGECS